MTVERRWELGLALLLMAVFGVHVWTKWSNGTLLDLLWFCNLSAPLVAIATLLNWPRAVTAGFVFFLSVGLPAYLLDLVVGSSTTVASMVLHVGALVLGGLVVRRAGAWRGAGIAGVAVLITVEWICRLFTPADMNINLSHRVWEPLEPWFPSWYAYFAFNTAVFGATLIVTGHLLSTRWPLLSEDGA